ncbi:MAG: hypothetical protein M3R52_04245 [Acidobacteriota bacterium]|nr:hypothetical protein [Acidobacteriota bacterium]
MLFAKALSFKRAGLDRMIRVEIKPELLSWARERAGFDADALAHRFPKLAAWEQGTARPTLKQIERVCHRPRLTALFTNSTN